MKAYVPFSFSLGKEDADYKNLVNQQLVARGVGRTPSAPRDLQAQPGSRGALITWKLPAGRNTEYIRGWRIYKDTESNLHSEIQDPGRRQIYVTLTAGDTPPITNFFISAITQGGAESTKVQIKAQSLAETGAPAVPSTPPGYTTEGSGGGTTGYYGGGIGTKSKKAIL
jgi:hypothetical protein